MLYFDYAATTYVDPRVLEQMNPYFEQYFANPSAKHKCGKKVQDAVDSSRSMLADLMGALPDEIVFTAGASESNNLAIKGVAECFETPRHFITTKFEHKSALEAFKQLCQWGHSVSFVSPGPHGVIDPQSIERAIIPGKTALCSIMHVNNEIGTIQPIHEIARICRENNILFHTDATQSFGKLAVKATPDIDFISISAHKFYGPPGVGALYIAKDIKVTCQIAGGSQENGLRAGTLNVPGIVGIAQAAKLAISHLKDEYDRLKSLEQQFLTGINLNIPMAFLQGDQAHKVPWINNICFHGVDGNKLRDELGNQDICVSMTSACAKSTQSPSHVLASIGTDSRLSGGAIRFSFGRRTTPEKIKTLIKETTRIVSEIRNGNI